MAATVGDLAVRVGADITDLKKGMDRGSRTVGRFASKSGRQLRQTANSLAKVGAAAVAAGAAMVAGLYHKGSQAIDAQAKLARSVGSTVVSIQSLERTAELAGIAQDTMGKSAAKLNQRIGEAMRGTGEAVEQFKLLGIEAKTLEGLEADERLAMIADRMVALNYSSSQAADALRDFGIREEKMVGLMLEGGDAFRSARRDVNEFGMAVSDVDAAKVEAANDAMTAMGVTMKVVANTVAIQLSPFVQEVGERFGQSAKQTKGFKSEIQQAVEGGIRGFAKLADVIHGLRVVLKGVEVIAVGFGGAFISAVQLAMEGFTAFNDQVNRVVNSIIRTLNQIPNVNIGELGMLTDSDFMKDLRALGDSVRNKVGQVRGELHELAMQEMPSAKVEEFLEAVAQRAQESAEQVVAARNKMIGMPEDQMGGGMSEEEKEKQEKALEAIRNRYLTEQELLREHRETMALIGEEYDAAKFETETEWRAIREQAEQEHVDRLVEMRRKGMTDIEKFQAMSMQNQIKTVTGALVNMTAGVASENKKMFELNKKAGIANAVISAYQGIATTLGTYPFPLSVAMAAVQAAAAFAQVSAIRSQSFGAGGAAPSLAGGTAAPPTTDVQNGTPQAQPQQTMRVEGLDKNSLFSGEATQQIAQNLLDFQKDGGQVVFAG